MSANRQPQPARQSGEGDIRAVTEADLYSADSDIWAECGGKISLEPSRS